MDCADGSDEGMVTLVAKGLDKFTLTKKTTNTTQNRWRFFFSLAGIIGGSCQDDDDMQALDRKRRFAGKLFDFIFFGGLSLQFCCTLFKLSCRSADGEGSTGWQGWQGRIGQKYSQRDE